MSVATRVEIEEIVAEPLESARAAGLRYVHDDGPGIRRLRSGTGFRYVDARGHAVREAATLRRIRALVIPPAWTDVWICPHLDGHIQATGRDARRRKQYRYHERWREVRDATKYQRTIAFGRALPRIRSAVEKDLSVPGLPRDKVIATVVRLLEVTNIRVGNEEYARTNHSFGLTTLRDRHVDVAGSKISIHFRGKSGKSHAITVEDRRLAKIVARCSELPGHELFQYEDEGGQRCPVESTDVNAYLHRVAGDAFTAKDFRTWSGTVLAARALASANASGRATTRVLREAVASVAARLGNTPAVCRRCYIHPAVLDAYSEGRLSLGASTPRSEERALLALLQGRLRREAA